MKRIFVSDFDSTLTKRDFYKIMIEDYLGDEGKTYYENWIKDGKISVSFLNKIFSWIEVDDKTYEEMIDKVEIDSFLADFRTYLSSQHIDFMIVSAGFDLYIKDALKRLDLDDIKVMTNPGLYENQRLLMVPDKSKHYYSELFGIDKGKIVQALRADYDKIYFAGDSEPDFKAAKHADVVFAKEMLADMMDREGKAYIRYDNFKDIHKYLAGE